MSKFLKLFFKDFIIYGVGASAQLIVGLILLPVLTRIFDPSQYGVIDLSNSFIQIYGTIFAFGLTTATAFYYYDSKLFQEKKITISTSVFFLLFCNLSIFLVLFLFAAPLSQILFSSVEYILVFKFSLFLAISSILYTYFLYILRIARRPWRYIINSVLKIFLDLIFILLFIVIFKQGIRGYFLGLSTSIFTATLVLLWVNRKFIIFRFSSKRLKELLKFGLPLLPTGIALWVLQLVNRYFLIHYSTLDKVGLYAVAVRSTVLVLLVLTSFKLAWIPFAFSIMKKENANVIFLSLYKYFLIVITWLAIATSLFAKEVIPLITTSEYISAYTITPFLCLGTILFAIYHIVSIGIVIKKKTHLLSLIIGAAAIVNLGLNYIFIPRWNIMGAAIVSVIAYFVAAVLAYIISNKIYPIKFDIFNSLIMLILAALITALGFSIDFRNVLSTILLKTLLLAIYPFLLYILGVINKNEKQQGLYILNKIISNSKKAHL